MATYTENLKLYKPDSADKVITFLQELSKSMEILDGLIGVGSIHFFSKDVNPNILFPGTSWTQLHDVFLVASGRDFTPGSTGGTSEHQHAVPVGFDGKTIYFHHDTSGNPAYGSQTLLDNVYTEEVTYNQAGNLREGMTKTASNLPPYRAVYVWERTA